MKTDFLSAVRLLQEGRCESIMLEHGIVECTLLNGMLSRVLNGKPELGIVCMITDFLGQWQINGYKPVYETVTVERSILIDRETGEFKEDITEGGGTFMPMSMREIVISVDVQRPVREKIRHREEIEVNKWPVRCIDGGHSIPERAKCFAEWED